MKKKTVILVFLVLTMLTGCRNTQTDTKPSSNVTNPIKTYKNAGEMNKALGFDMVKLPANLGFVADAYETINDRIGQLTYVMEQEPEPSESNNALPQKSAAPQDEQKLTLRMAKGEEDISGIYGVEYGDETIKSIDINVGVYQNSTYIAWWVYNGCSYSVTTANIDKALFNTVTESVIGEILGLSAEE